MRISLRWLKDYTGCSYSPDELAQRLTMAGLEVENIDRLGEKYERFVVGRVRSVGRHPSADRLTLCQVETGSEVVQIVCGAPNVAAAQKVAVGLVGARVPHDQHDPDGKSFELRLVNIRGERSAGMICSAFELDLGTDKDGIMVLDAEAKVGQSLASYLGLDDVQFEIGITPNRPDCLSHIGVAREIAAFSGGKLKIPATKLMESKTPAGRHGTVRIENVTDCPRYTARILFGLTNRTSPAWLRERLEAVGIRPVNAIVDVTNYVLMECGHPLHAFDYDLLHGGAIVVRSAAAGELFVTLDHKTRRLRAETLLICDSDRPVAVAGVMGGENSEISDSTSNVLLESAYFRPQNIRRTSKYLGLSTEASQRFERGADPNITRWAADRAAQLMREICGGEVLKGAIDVYPRKVGGRTVELRPEKANELLGTTLSAEKIKSLLHKLEIETAPKGSRRRKGASLAFRVPTFRPDLEREVDLIEEVARVHGYDKIETTASTRIHLPEHADQTEFAEAVRGAAIGVGFRETVSNSMQEKDVALMASDNIVEILNPISKEMSALRTSLLPGMLQIVRNNIYHGESNLRLFEIGKIYSTVGNSGAKDSVGNFSEHDQILLILTGLAEPSHWGREGKMVDIYNMKGEIQTFFETIFLDNINFIPYPTTKALTENGLFIEINSEYAGDLGAVRKDILEKFEIEQPVFAAELELDVLSKHRRVVRQFAALPKYPPVARDIAIITDDKIRESDLERVVKLSGGPMLRKVELFDIYSGDQAGPGKKSYAFALEFMAEDHTLAQDEVDRVMERIMEGVSKELGASIRK